MQHTSDPSEIRKLVVDLPKFLEKWAGQHATVHLKGSTVTMAGTILPGPSEQIIIGGRWHYRGTIIVRDAADDIEIDFLSVAGAT